METGLDGGMLRFLPVVLVLFWLFDACLAFFYLRFRFLEYLRVQVSSRALLLSLTSVESLWCASVLVLLGWSEFAFEALVGGFSNL